MQDIEYYQIRLDRVSRSFAFCIRELQEPLRGWVSLSYLLCRALDTIEDAPWGSAFDQNSQYEAFESFLKVSPSKREVQQWCSRFPLSIPEGEKFLIEDASFLFEDLHALPKNVRS